MCVLSLCVKAKVCKACKCQTYVAVCAESEDIDDDVSEQKTKNENKQTKNNCVDAMISVKKSHVLMHIHDIVYNTI